MKPRALVVCVSAWMMAACNAAAPAQSLEQQLTDSFARQIVSTGIVRDLRRDGDTLWFSARYGKQPDAKWRVHIDSATIEPQADGTTSSKGIVKSSWFVDGEPIRPRGSQSDLPLAFLDAGIAQECWAFRDNDSRQWSWK
jgi:hypothetical protein